MTTPLLLNMLVASLIQEKGIPKTKVELVEILINWYLEREAIRASGKMAPTSTKEAINQLGKQAWEAFSEGKSTVTKVKTRIRFVPKCCKAGNEARKSNMYSPKERPPMGMKPSFVVFG